MEKKGRRFFGRKGEREGGEKKEKRKKKIRLNAAKKGRKTLFERKDEVKERKERERWFLEERVNERERVPPSCVDKKEMRRKKEEKSFFGRKGEREGKGKKEKREKRIFWKEE